MVNEYVPLMKIRYDPTPGVAVVSDTRMSLVEFVENVVVELTWPMLLYRMSDRFPSYIMTEVPVLLELNRTVKMSVPFSNA